MNKFSAVGFTFVAMFCMIAFPLFAGVADALSYAELQQQFLNPEHDRWGEVPLWWWEGQRMTEERASAELEILAEKGVKSVCPIQRSPGRCDPQSFDDNYWKMLAHVNKECQRLGMTLWAYDQVGYGHYGWLEKAAAAVQDPETKRIELHQKDGEGGQQIRLELPEGEVLAARAYPLRDGQAFDEESLDLTGEVSGSILAWELPEGHWRVVCIVAVPFQSFYLSKASTDAFIDMFYGKIERVLGTESMGESFVGVFQDEHPPTPRDVYTQAFAEHFKHKHGYDVGRAIPALHFDVGLLTPKYRIDFFDAYLDIVEATYWKPIYDWTMERGLLTSHDNWGRNNIEKQSEGYIDYFRTQRWFSAPGYDDAGQRPIKERNYYDTKIAASIARLYGRQRVWNEAFHSSGWGRTTEQTLSWLSAGMAFGANLYDEHGLYYSTNASTWEHAAPDPHWRQPYWVYYDTLSDFVARTSYLMSQGTHVVDAAVHYPVVSVLAGKKPDDRPFDYNRYMKVSRLIYDAGIDNDIIDDESILAATIENGRLVAAGNAYQALVFGPEHTIRRAVVEKALALAKSGGVVLFTDQLPTASTEDGRDDPKLQALLQELLGTKSSSTIDLENTFEGGGFAAYTGRRIAKAPELISQHIERDFIADEMDYFVSHRKINDTEVYLVQNALEDTTRQLNATFRVQGIPELWDPFTGAISPVDAYEIKEGCVHVHQEIAGTVAHFFVFRPETEHPAEKEKAAVPDEVSLSDEWAFSVIPTRNNQWGEFRWPPAETLLGPEVRELRYLEVPADAKENGNWRLPEYDDTDWSTCLYSTGPYWLFLSPETAVDDMAAVLKNTDQIAAGASMLGGAWQELRFSKTIGLAKPAPWGGHSGYPDGHIDKNFIQLPEGRKLLFTHLSVAEAQRRGLRVELRNATPRLWVNGVEQPFEDAVGNLPLKEGENTILLDLPDGSYGRLFVQADPPSVATMAEAAKGIVEPAIDNASWIWAGNTQSCFVRKTFELDKLPEQARIVVSAFSGYRLIVNGKQIEEEIGPWSDWKKPESFTITPLLQKGENVIAIWGQLFAGQNVNKGPEAFRSRGIVAAVKMRYDDDTESGFVTDASWRGTMEEVEGWERPGFDDADWQPVMVQGVMGDAPWNMDVVNNIGKVTEPKRPLSIDLESPYLTCFDEVPDLVYDIKAADTTTVGWFRFDAPPGLHKLHLHTQAPAQVWVDGIEATVQDGIAVVQAPPKESSKVAVRVEMLPGAYAGAVFPEPIGLELRGGVIKPGLWSDYALPTYSGIGVYSQTLELSEAQSQHRLTLDLGKVLVAAEVFVNGKSAGVRLAQPFTYNLSELVNAGANTIEVRVANTIAPHYLTIPSHNLGPVESGLLGPVHLYMQ